MADQPRLPLEGVRVLDITLVWSGPAATRLMGELGAEVIRVESCRRFPSSTRGPSPDPEQARRAQATNPAGQTLGYPGNDPGPDPYNRFGPFILNGVNKLSCTMELDTPEGREAFHALVRQSDVLVENNHLAGGDSIGLTWDELAAVNPRLILVRMAPFGLSGPYAPALGFGTHFESITGIRALRGYPDAGLEEAGPTYHMDDTSASGVVFAVLAALMHRDRTGRGQLVEFAQVENLMQGVGEAFLDVAMNGRVPPVMGNRHPLVLQGCYPCRGDDAWLALHIATDAEWEGLVEAMGRPAWAREPRVADAAGRRAHQEEIDRHLAAWTASWDKMDLFHHLARHGVPAAPVATAADVLADPHLEARGFWRSLTHPAAGTYRYPGPVARWSGGPWRWERPAPLLGEHNAYVYGELLGYDAATLRDWEERGLVGTRYRVGPADDPRPARTP
ncbi:MAG: CoA transferase [Actinomycetia bacterium]|nr:CoA transferase [Actinomycetes bacterium]